LDATNLRLELFNVFRNCETNGIELDEERVLGLLVEISVFEVLGDYDGKKLWVSFFAELDCDDLTV
jgi:hypothetical protein